MSKRGAEKGEPKLPAPSDVTTVLPPAVRNGRVARKPSGQVQEAVMRWRNAIPEENPAFPMLCHPSMLFPASWQLHGLYQSYACTMSGPIDSKGIFYMALGMYSGGIRGNLPSGQKAHGFQMSIAVMTKCPSLSYYWVSFQGQSTVLPVTPTGLSVEKHHLPF